MPSASVRVITKMIAATFLTSGPKRRSSSSYDVQLAAEIRRQEQHAHQEAADHVAQRQLQERHVRCIGAGRHADEAQRAGLGGDDGEADRPPRHRTAGQEVVAGGLLEPREPRTEGGDGEQVGGNDCVVDPGEDHAEGVATVACRLIGVNARDRRATALRAAAR